MTLPNLAARSFRYYFRANAAAIAGAAIATAVITGALLVGYSVRESLRDLASARLGSTGEVLSSATFFRDALASEIAPGAVPLIAVEGVVTRPSGNRRLSGVQVYAVDSRFWAFHKVPEVNLGNREAALSAAVAKELDLKPGEPLLIRLEKPSAIPRESLHGRKEDSGKTIRVTAAAILDRKQMGEFALRPQQGPTRAIFVRLDSFQKDLDRRGRANTILFPEQSHPALDKVTLEDLGITLKPGLDVESESAVISPALEEAVRKAAQPAPASPFLTYLVNRITDTASNKTVPYSLIAGATAPYIDVVPGKIVLNDWAAHELGVSPGARLRLEYYVWDPQGTLSTKTSEFELARIIPTVNDRSLAPEYPGITDSESLANWDPPFPMNLKLVRAVDEEYWKRYRTTPKGFISIEDARRIWGTRFGQATLMRIRNGSLADTAAKLRSLIDPSKLGMILVDARSSTAAASQGSTDFGEYFLYFSFFLVISALLLLVLFFQFGIEQRTREIGMLRAVGFRGATVRRLFVLEGGRIAIVGSCIGVPLGIAYSALVLLGLRTIWKSAVGTTELTLHISPEALIAGGAAGLAFAIMTILFTVRRLGRRSPRELLSGSRSSDFSTVASPVKKWTAILAAAFGLGLAAAGVLGKILAAGAFFGSGALLLVAALTAIRLYLGRPGAALAGISSLGFRNASWNPVRSTLSIALVASASFLLLALESFRQHDTREGTGGYSMAAESEIPIVYDLNTPQGRDAVGLSGRHELDKVRFTAFRLKPGDDSSCLNLYEPRNPRVIGAGAEFLASNRFAAPWRLLTEPQPDGLIPAIGDANSLEYVLHKKIGDIVELPNGVRLKIVAALENSVLQSELIVSQENFIRAFPSEQGFRFFLIDGPLESRGPLEDALSDFGFEASSAADRLAGYHQVENTYLSTFQVLGALGLLLGTAGLSAVLLRNLVERRKELALLLAVGFRPRDLGWMIVAENAFLALCGLAIGLASALVAILPVLAERGKISPGMNLAGFILSVPLVAVLASAEALRMLRKMPLLESLRSG
jgi:putative ABC transport system permease protein